MRRQKVYSFINIAGLAIGMTCTILILLWVQNELSYDRFHKDAYSLFVVTREVRQPDQIVHSAYTSAQLAIVLKEEFPEVLHTASMGGPHEVLVKRGDKAFYEDGSAITENSFFDIFTLPFLKGDPKTALSDTSSIVITEEVAKKYFGKEDPLGKILNWNNWGDYRVTGVVKNIPENSFIRFDMLRSHQVMKIAWRDGLQWENKIFRTFVKLRKDVDTESFSQRVTEVITNKYPNHSQYDVKYYFFPVTKIHLYSLGGGGAIKYVYLFSLIAFFILFIACINFMNLSTARSANRAREVGLRKVVGSKRIQLVKQFFGESIILAFFAYCVSLLLVRLFLPGFNKIAGKHLSIDILDPWMIFGPMTVIFITGLLAGSYPAFYLSSFTPANVLKGTMKTRPGGAVFRKVLVITQFSLSIGLIIASIIVNKQVDYLRNKELGFDKNNIVYIPMKANLGKNYNAVKTNLLQNPNILAVTAKDRLHTRAFDIDYIEWEGKDPEQELEVEIPWVDFDYFETLNMEVLKGRDFSKQYPSDVEDAFIVNEEAVRLMGLESPLGTLVTTRSGRKGRIIGVVKNAHFRSRRFEVIPEIYVLIPDFIDNGELDLFGVILVKIKEGNIPEGISALKNVWDSVNPDHPFTFHFFDAALDVFYKSEMKMSTISKWFSFLAVFISCLGLFGLASYMAEKRTREIGVRKVLGAGVSEIVRLLSREFVRWIIYANIIAWPVSYFVLNHWIRNYVYRIGINWWVFTLSGAAALGIALLSVSYQAVKAARANPVEALRYE